MATTPRTALGPGGCHPRGRTGLSRTPARTPQSPKSHWEVWAGEARNEEGSKGGFAVVTEADGDEMSGAGPPFMERPSLLGARFRIGHLPGLVGIVMNPVQNGYFPELAEVEVSVAVPSQRRLNFRRPSEAGGGRDLGDRPGLFRVCGVPKWGAVQVWQGFSRRRPATAPPAPG